MPLLNMESFLGVQDLSTLQCNVGTIFVFTVIFILLCVLLRKPAAIPPGPFWTMPLVGDLPLLLGRDLPQTFKRLQGRYGDIFSFYIGRKLIIVINGYELINKAAVRNGGLFSGRPRNFFFIEKSCQGRGIVMSDGPFWQRQRKFTHDRLQEFGFGKSSFESRIITEVKAFIHDLTDQDGAPYDIRHTIRTSMANVVFAVASGRRHEYSDPTFQKLLSNLDHKIKVMLRVSMLNIFLPFLKYIWMPFDLFGFKKLREIQGYFTEYVRKLYHEHTQRDKNGEIDDLMDAYIREMNQSVTRETDTDYTFDQLVDVMDDLLGAGSETSATAICWGVLYLLHYPHIKKRLQTDIDEVIKDNRLPCLNDKPRLPYVEAFIMELLRITNIVPFGLPRAILSTHDIIFEGYKIPKECSIFFNFQSVHLDPQNFEDPLLLNPDRFLDSSGQIVKPKEYMPFGIGRRICLGEPVAKMEIFLFLTAMLKEFDFLPEQEGKIPSLQSVVGMTNAPSEYKIRAIRRTS